MLFSTDLRLSTYGLYIVGCPSNGRRASSISALPAPATQTSADGTACSLLPAADCAAAQASPSPYYSHRWSGHPSTHPLPLLFYGNSSLTPQPNKWTLVLLSVWASTATSSPAPHRPLPRPCRRPPPWCSRRGVVNVVNVVNDIPSEEYCTWRGWQLGAWPQPSFFVICQVSRFVRPVGLQIFQDEESFIRLAEKMAYQ